MLLRLLFVPVLPVLLLGGLACGSTPSDLSDAALAPEDVPDEWVAAELDDAHGQALWDTLPEVLLDDSDARLIIHAYEEESGLHGAATLFIEAGSAQAIPESDDSDEFLGPLSLLLSTEDAMLLPEARGGDPKAYFSVSELPTPQSIRSRLVRLIDDDLVHSDSLTFNVGNVLAVVTVWYPEDGAPVEDVAGIAERVESRLRSVVDET